MKSDITLIRRRVQRTELGGHISPVVHVITSCPMSGLPRCIMNRVSVLEYELVAQLWVYE